MSLSQLVDLSRRYGSDPEWVLAGGGNTSYKDEDHLYIKASGHALATIDESGFARMERAALKQVWAVRYPDDRAEREARALGDLMAARSPGEEKRPSVETLMHELFPCRYVIHTHPSVVNGLTCAADGAAGALRLFGSRVLWIDAIEAGYLLAVHMRARAAEYRQSTGEFPKVVLLQNHGLVIASDDPDEIVALHEDVQQTIGREAGARPDLAEAEVDTRATGRWSALIRDVVHSSSGSPGPVAFTGSPTARGFVASRVSFQPVSLAFTPDHIVYSGPRPVWIEGPEEEGHRQLSEAVAAYREEYGLVPRIFGVKGLGVFACADSEAASETALSLFVDEMKIATFAGSFGGARPLDPHLVEFILTWEVERYRKKVSEGGQGE